MCKVNLLHFAHFVVKWLFSWYLLSEFILFRQNVRQCCCAKWYKWPSKVGTLLIKFTCPWLRNWIWSKDRKIVPTPASNQMAEFSEYSSLTIKEINKRYLHYIRLYVIIESGLILIPLFHKSRYWCSSWNNCLLIWSAKMLYWTGASCLKHGLALTSVNFHRNI